MTSILWQRLDGPGSDRATISPDATGHRLAGTALLTAGDASYEIRYSVLADSEWQTRVAAAFVHGPDGERRLSLAVDDKRRWSVGDEVIADLDGAVDVDFAFTPATNTLPIRRLDLEVGEAATISVAKVAFPDRNIELIEQRYERLDDTTYRYSSGDTSADLTVGPDGLVTDYPGLWQAV